MVLVSLPLCASLTEASMSPQEYQSGDIFISTIKISYAFSILENLFGSLPALQPPQRSIAADHGRIRTGQANIQSTNMTKDPDLEVPQSLFFISGCASYDASDQMIGIDQLDIARPEGTSRITGILSKIGESEMTFVRSQTENHLEAQCSEQCSVLDLPAFPRHQAFATCAQTDR